MKKLVFVLFIFLSFVLKSQNVNKVDNLIPSLQYDDDMMVYVDFSVLDGFNVVKQIKGLMKFVKGQKVYALEKDIFNGKKITKKITFFYLGQTPIAISVEKGGQTTLFYIDNGQVYASKTFKQALYKPYGGKKPLDIRELATTKSPKTLSAKYLKQAGSLLNDVRSAARGILNYGF